MHMSGITMADDDQLSKNNHVTGDSGEDEKSSEGSPPQKKPKIDEESDGAEEEEMETSENDCGCDGDCDCDASDEEYVITDEQLRRAKREYCPPGVDEVDHDVWSKYFQEIEQSDGFDIYHYPGDCFPARFTPMIGLEKSALALQEMTDYSNAAIEGYNRCQKTNYKVEKVEKANRQLWDTGVNYYITFQAKDGADAFTDFQALVWSDLITDNNVVVKSCRLRPPTST